MERALEGLLVLDLSQYLAGPMAGMVLADLGAEVIRVDPPGGPRWQHPANAIVQRGKKSITLHLKDPENRALIEGLIARADIVIESFRPGAAQTLGIGPESNLALNPRLIHLSLPGFSADDPRADWPAWDGVLNAAAGFYLYPGCIPMDYVGDRTGEPIFSAIPQASFMGGLVALHSLAAALYARERTGRGQHIDMSLHEASFELIGACAMRTAIPREAGGFGQLTGVLPQLGHYQGSDGMWLELCLFQDKHLEWFAREFMPEEWIADGMADPQRLVDDGQLRERARQRFAALIATRPAREWEKLINDVSGASAAVSQTTRQWLRDDEDARANEAVIELEDPILGHTVQAGYPVRLSRTPLRHQGPRHLPDKDRQHVLGILNRPPQQFRPGPEPDLRQALAGIRVLDTAQVLAGPTTSRVLAEYGAEVVKIHSFEDRQLGMHPYTNSGKTSVMLNIKSSAGREIFDQLATGIDVFVQNFTRGVAERIGMGESRLRQLSPDLIYTSISAFGYDGYRGGWRGREQLGQGVTGMQVRLAGEGNSPVMAAFAYCDYSTGNFAAFGTIIALYHRLRTGQSQTVHASLSATGSFLQLPYLLDYDGAPHDEPAGPEAQGRGPLDRLYRGADRWLYVAGRPDQIRKVGEALGLTLLEEETPKGQEEQIAECLAQWPAEHSVQILVEAGVGAHILRDLDELMDDSYALDKGLVVTRDHPGIGEVTVAGPSPRLTATPVVPGEAVGPPGYDTRDVLERLGYGDSFDDLVAQGVVREGLPAGTEFIGMFR